MNAAAKELPVSYDLSKPQEDREPYVGSVLFFKHVIFTVTLLLILIPTTLSIYLFAQVRSLNRQLDTAGSQLAWPSRSSFRRPRPRAASLRRPSPSLRRPRSPPTRSFTPSCTPTIRCAAPWTWTTPST